MPPVSRPASRPGPPGLLVCLSLWTLLGPSAWAADPAVDFGRDVLPILSDHCLRCHGPDPLTRKADLRLDQKDSALRAKDPIVVPGQSAESPLIERVCSTDPDEVMPPPKVGKPLTAAQIDVLKRWVDSGAKWGGHWAFETPKRPDPPAVRDTTWPRDTLDRFVLARLDAEKLAPAPEAPKATLIRRVTLDLTGLPPTPEEVDAFLADTRPDAYERVVDRLLASPHYGERLAFEWLDQARFADTNGYQNDFARTMWPWRDWVIAAFNANQPFDRFVTDQLAGDLLPDATLAQKVATGFNRNNRTVTEAGSIDEEWRIENAVDRVETTATVFLGLTMGCARCHSHKYDPISQKEFYSFLGFFNSVNEQGVYTETRGNVPPLVSVPPPADAEKLRRLSDALAAAEKTAASLALGRAARQAIWEGTLKGQPEEPGGLAWRAPLAGSLDLLGPDGMLGSLSYKGQGTPAWADGPDGKSFRLDGKEATFAESPATAAFERTEPASYGGWVRPEGSGALLSKMDDAGGYRGFDVLMENGKVQAHLVSQWPGDALKVTTRDALPANAWSHVLVTYDGSSKAAGLSVYVNGRRVAVDVQADTLKGPVKTDQPLRIGRRSTSASLKGLVADVRLYRRVLSPAEIQALVDGPALRAARKPAGERSAGQAEQVTRLFRDRFDAEGRAADEKVAALKAEKAAVEKGVPTVMVMADRPQPRPTYVLKRGRYDMPDKDQSVAPGVPACLPPLPSGAPPTRLGLARWLVSPDHPLTARVAVNRVWQQHFGQGLVKTAENFGLQSEPPSHPELLDSLATAFVESGWDLKALHRRVVTSATYRQSSAASAVLVQRDPENRLLARGPRFRLPAEVVRDNALAVAGLLADRLGGPSVKPYQPAGLWEELAGGAGEGPYVQSKGADLYRRSLYVYRKRTVPHPVMANFDAPSREVCQVKRPRTNTPLQALELLNDVTYVEAARALAQKALAEGGADDSSRLTYAFRRATARRPSDSELSVLKKGLERYRTLYRADRDAAAQIVKQGESPVPAGVDSAELAAYTAAAGVILNLDETITLE